MRSGTDPDATACDETAEVVADVAGAATGGAEVAGTASAAAGAVAGAVAGAAASVVLGWTGGCWPWGCCSCAIPPRHAARTKTRSVLTKRIENPPLFSGLLGQLKNNVYKRRRVVGGTVALRRTKAYLLGCAKCCLIKSVTESLHHAMHLQLSVGAEHHFHQDLAFHVQLPGLGCVNRLGFEQNLYRLGVRLFFMVRLLCG